MFDIDFNSILIYDSLLYLGRRVRSIRTGRPSRNARPRPKRLTSGTGRPWTFRRASTSRKASSGGWPCVFYSPGLSSTSSRCEASNLPERYHLKKKNSQFEFYRLKIHFDPIGPFFVDPTMAGASYKSPVFVSSL